MQTPLNESLINTDEDIDHHQECFMHDEFCLWSASSISSLSSSSIHHEKISNDMLVNTCDGTISSQAVDLQFNVPYQVISSSVLGGGSQVARRYINLLVGS